MTWWLVVRFNGNAYTYETEHNTKAEALTELKRCAQKGCTVRYSDYEEYIFPPDTINYYQLIDKEGLKDAERSEG